MRAIAAEAGIEQQQYGVGPFAFTLRIAGRVESRAMQKRLPVRRRGRITDKATSAGFPGNEAWS